MKLLTNEQEITSSNENKIVLTNYRVTLNERYGGVDTTIIIFLENISSLEMHKKTNPLFLLLGILGLIIGIFLSFNGEFRGAPIVAFSLIAGLVFLGLYWFSRRHLVSIKSNGGTALEFEIAKMSQVDVEEFLFKVQEAKLQRANSL